MGACLAKPAPKRDLTFLVIGLDNSGKTTLTRTIAGDVDPFIVPTVGFSAPVHKALGGFNVTFYDLGGGARIRGVWPQYFADVHGVVYVVDAADAARLAEATRELHAALQHPMVIGKPTLVCVRAGSGGACARVRVRARVELIWGGGGRCRACRLTARSLPRPPQFLSRAVSPTRRTSLLHSTRAA